MAAESIERFVGLLYVAVGVWHLWSHSAWHGMPALWITKVALVCTAAGLLDLFAVSFLDTTLQFCLQLPIFPLFQVCYRL